MDTNNENGYKNKKKYGIKHHPVILQLKKYFFYYATK